MQNNNNRRTSLQQEFCKIKWIVTIRKKELLLKFLDINEVDKKQTWEVEAEIRMR